MLHTAPARGRLLNGLVARRAFGVLGPTEALFGLLASVVTVGAAGWRPGTPFPGGDVLLAASGATFAAVVVGQMANAFACRSSTQWVARSGWRGNRLLVAAVLAEAVVAGAFLYIPSVAAVLQHAPPVAAGWTIALLTGSAVITADLIDKTLRNRA